jgi:hypothetical protein
MASVTASTLHPWKVYGINIAASTCTSHVTYCHMTVLATKRARVSRRSHMWQLACQASQLRAQMCYVLLAVVVSISVSADGGEDV